MRRRIRFVGGVAMVWALAAMCSVARAQGTFTITATVTSPDNGHIYIGTPGQHFTVTFSSTHTYKVTQGPDFQTYSFYRVSDLTQTGVISGWALFRTDATGATPVWQDSNSAPQTLTYPNGSTDLNITANSHPSNVNPAVAFVPAGGFATQTITIHLYGEG
jgi:hypothetical protein